MLIILLIIIITYISLLRHDLLKAYTIPCKKDKSWLYRIPGGQFLSGKTKKTDNMLKSFKIKIFRDIQDFLGILHIVCFKIRYTIFGIRFLDFFRIFSGFFQIFQDFSGIQNFFKKRLLMTAFQIVQFGFYDVILNC